MMIRAFPETGNTTLIKPGVIIAGRPKKGAGARKRASGRGRPTRRKGGGRPFKKKVVDDREDKAVEIEGIVKVVLAGTMFRVELQSGHEVLAHISGKMRKRFIRLVVGDRVRMEMSPYDTTKARITFRIG
jgi:translation initiation factor IF-1